MSSRFKCRSINCIATQLIKGPKNTDCTICRENLNYDSLTAQEKGLSSVVVIGNCGCGFHYECIKKWVSINSICPICSKKWFYQKKDIYKKMFIGIKKKKIKYDYSIYKNLSSKNI